MASKLFLETSDALLLETGDALLLEDATAAIGGIPSSGFAKWSVAVMSACLVWGVLRAGGVLRVWRAWSQMPTLLMFHHQYWDNDRHSGSQPVPQTTTRGYYPLWQGPGLSLVIFGPPLDLLKACWTRIRWNWAAFRLLWKLPRKDQTVVLDALDRWAAYPPVYGPEERAVFHRIACLMADPAWRLARGAVRQTAGTLGFNEPAFWKDLSRALKENPGSAQNTFRHLHAVTLVRERAGLSNPDLHLVVEAAYHAFAAEPKKTIP